MESHFGKKSRFYKNGSNFLWKFEISLWMVEIFMMKGRDFHDDRSRFLLWQVEIFDNFPLSIAPPIFLHYSSPKTLQKTKKVLRGSKKPSHTSFFRLKKNTFCWRQSHVFPTLELPHKGTCHLYRAALMILRKRNQGFHDINLQFILLLMVTSFCLIWISQQQSPKKVYAILMDLEEPPYTVFSKQNSYLWWLPHFSHIKTSL